jgi:hypothetical protein
LDDPRRDRLTGRGGRGCGLRGGSCGLSGCGSGSRGSGLSLGLSGSCRRTQSKRGGAGRRGQDSSLLGLGHENGSLHGKRVLMADQGGCRIGVGILHGGKDPVGNQSLEGSLRPGTQKRTIAAFAIVSGSVGSVIPLGNHNGQGAAQHGGHRGTSRADIAAPIGQVGEARGLRVVLGATIFMPTHRIGTRLSLLHEALEIGGISLVRDRSDKLGVGSLHLE